MAPRQAYQMPDGKAGRAAALGCGCLVLPVVFWVVVVGLAAMHVLGMI